MKKRAKPRAKPQMTPTTAAMGIAVMLSVVETPARNTTASMPSLKTAEKQSRKMAQLVPFPLFFCLCRTKVVCSQTAHSLSLLCVVGSYEATGRRMDHLHRLLVRSPELALPLALIVHEAQHSKTQDCNKEGGHKVDVALEDCAPLAREHAVLRHIEHDDEGHSYQY